MVHVQHLDRSMAGEDPSHDPSIDPAHYFDGAVDVQRLVGPDESPELELLAVFFGRGARTKPHIHARDQVLYFLEGEGIVATENERVIAHPGDVVTTPAGTWHWHGATPNGTAAHISVRCPGTTDWEVDQRDWGLN